MANDRMTLTAATQWRDTWPDLLAFGGSLAMAWHFQWKTTDLVWSLWLSSLLVGYALIVWSIFGPAVYVGFRAWTGRELLKDVPAGAVAVGGVLYLVGGLFLLAFFTLHFGMFHYVHSAFLNNFFPVIPGAAKLSPGPGLFAAVLQRYWWFVPAAALAERQAFRFKPAPPAPPDTSVKAADIAARKARLARGGPGGNITESYKNVMRMHLLIFFFAFAHFVKLENFWIYAVVYAAYFFPWRVLRGEPSSAAAG